MKQKRSHVAIFCGYLATVAYGNVMMLQQGWALWSLFVVVFAVVGLVMARVMFREPKLTGKTGSEQHSASGNQSPAAPAPPSPGIHSSGRWPFRSSRPRPQSLQQAAASPPASTAESIMARLTTEYQLKVTEARTLAGVLDILDSFSRATAAERTKDPTDGGMQDAINNAKELLSADPKSWEAAELGTDLGPITLTLRKGQQAAAEPEKTVEPETAFNASGAEDVSS